MSKTRDKCTQDQKTNGFEFNVRGENCGFHVEQYAGALSVATATDQQETSVGVERRGDDGHLNVGQRSKVVLVVDGAEVSKWGVGDVGHLNVRQ